MRVIAGSAKGRTLSAPKGISTRPVTSKIRESLFDIWQGRINGTRFLDGFAGSGAMGIEAISRGAAHATFIERSGDALSAIRANLGKCGFSDRSTVCGGDVLSVLGLLDSRGDRYDIIYLDPPFTVENIAPSVLEMLSCTSILVPEGIAAIRARKEESIRDSVGPLLKVHEKIYGISRVHFFETRSTA